MDMGGLTFYKFGVDAGSTSRSSQNERTRKTLLANRATRQAHQAEPLL